MSFERIASPGYYIPRQRITTQLNIESDAMNSGVTDGNFYSPTSTYTDTDMDDLRSPVARNLVRERRTCKSFRGEVVWPPKVEAALVEALEKLLPSAIESCVTKANLFPDRNKFCANFIRERTGAERTPRQVGSRIQMLRGKWRGTKNFQLVALPRELDASGNVDLSDNGRGSTTERNSAYTRGHAYGSESSPSPTSPHSGSMDDRFPSRGPAMPPHGGPSLICWTGVKDRADFMRDAYREYYQSSSNNTDVYFPRGTSGLPPLTTQLRPNNSSTPLHYNCVVELPDPSKENSQPPFYTTSQFASSVLLSEWSLVRTVRDNEVLSQEAVWVQLMSTNGTEGVHELGNYVTEVAPSWLKTISSSGPDISHYVVYQHIFLASQQRMDSHRPTEIPPHIIAELTHTIPTYVMVYNFRFASETPPLQSVRHWPLRGQRPGTAFDRSPRDEFRPVPNTLPLPRPLYFMGFAPTAGHSSMPYLPRLVEPRGMSRETGLKQEIDDDKHPALAAWGAEPQSDRRPSREDWEGSDADSPRMRPRLRDVKTDLSTSGSAGTGSGAEEDPVMGSLQDDYASPVSPIQNAYAGAPSDTPASPASPLYPSFSNVGRSASNLSPANGSYERGPGLANPPPWNIASMYSASPSDGRYNPSDYYLS